MNFLFRKIKKTSFIVSVVLIISTIFCNNGLAALEGAEEIDISINARQKTLTQICNDIYEISNYRVTFLNASTTKKISININKAKLYDALKTILKKAGIENYTIIEDKENRIISIKSYGAGDDSIVYNNPMETNKGKKEGGAPILTKKDASLPVVSGQNEQMPLKKDDEIVPGVTLEAMEKLTNEAKKDHQHLSDEYEIVPGVTKKTLEMLSTPANKP